MNKPHNMLIMEVIIHAMGTFPKSEYPMALTDGNDGDHPPSLILSMGGISQLTNVWDSTYRDYHKLHFNSCLFRRHISTKNVYSPGDGGNSLYRLSQS